MCRVESSRVESSRAKWNLSLTLVNRPRISRWITVNDSHHKFLWYRFSLKSNYYTLRCNELSGDGVCSPKLGANLAKRNACRQFGHWRTYWLQVFCAGACDKIVSSAANRRRPRQFTAAVNDGVLATPCFAFTSHSPDGDTVNSRRLPVSAALSAKKSNWFV